MTIHHLLPPWIPAFPLTPPLGHGHGHPGDPHHAGHDAVGDLAAPGIIAQAETQAAVDDPQGDQRAAEGDMRQGPETGLALAHIHHVVELPEDGLEGQEDDDDDADDGMVRVNLIESSSAEGSPVRGPHVPPQPGEDDILVDLVSAQCTRPARARSTP